MPVIALTQEMGSLAKEVSQALAADMGLTVMRHEVDDHIAQRMAVKPNLIRRLREGKTGMFERMSVDSSSVAIYTAEELFELANRGNVVLRGWGASRLLRAVPHVLCVRITRSFENRVAWLMEHLDVADEDTAAAEIRRSDAAHARRMHEIFDVRWGDPVLYDLVLNTDRLSPQSCAALIRTANELPEFQETEASRATLKNLTLQAHVRAALRADPDSDHTNIHIEALGGQVTLRGIVTDARELAAAEKVAKGVAGVSVVLNELRPMLTGSRFVTRTDD